MKARIVLGGIFHETNTFLRQRTTIKAFERFLGTDIFSLRGNKSPISGVLQFAEAKSWEVIPAAYFRGRPSGIVDNDVFETCWESICSRIPENPDGVFLVLHGAMVTDCYDDVEGELLARIRRHLGNDVPIFGVLDLHANFTKAMATHADFLLTYRKNPHTDALQTAVKSAEYLAHYFERRDSLQTTWQHSRSILPPLHTGTDDEPMRGLERLAREMEKAHDEVYALNIIAGFAHADTPDSGVSYSLIHTEDTSGELVQNIFHQLDDHLYRNCDSLQPEYDLPDAIESILREQAFPAAIVEPADNIGGGTPGENTQVLCALLNYPIQSAGIILNDPDSVQVLEKHESGTRLCLSLGGKSGELGAVPLPLEIELVRITDGRFSLEDAHSHLASSVGREISMGPCAVVRHNGITILLTSRPTPPFDLGQWYSQGLDPRKFQIIAIKAAVAHRQAYDSLCKVQYYVRTTGPCSSDLRSLPYQKLNRPIWPLNPLPSK